jgi:hypothetical protein
VKKLFSPVAFEDQHNGLFYPIGSGVTELPDEVAERAIWLHADKGVRYADLTEIAQAQHLGLAAEAIASEEAPREAVPEEEEAPKEAVPEEG